MEFAWPDAGTVLQFYRLTLSLLIWVMTGLASLASIVCLLCLLLASLSRRRDAARPD